MENSALIFSRLCVPCAFFSAYYQEIGHMLLGERVGVKLWLLHIKSKNCQKWGVKSQHVISADALEWLSHTRIGLSFTGHAQLI